MKTEKRRKRLMILAAVMLLIAAAVAGQYYLHHYTVVNGRIFNRSLETLDLSGAPLSNYRQITRFYNLKSLDLRNTGITIEAYSALRQALPECEILWEVPFQGSYLHPDTTSIAISSLTDADLEALRFLPGLSDVDASGCQDYPQLLSLQQLYPDCRISYSVSVDGSARSADADTLEIAHLDPAELENALPYLPKVQTIILTGALPDTAAVSRFQADFPSISLFCRMGQQDIRLDPEASRIDLSELSLTFDQAQFLLACHPNLTEAEMLGCDLTPEEMFRLCDMFPHCFILWEIPFANQLIRTDSVLLDISGYRVSGAEEVEALLPYLPRLEKVVMSECGLDSRQMDALNKRYADIRFVWTVHIGFVSLRTDAIFFAPVVTGYKVSQEQTHDLMYCTDLIAIDVGHMELTSCEWLAYMPNLQYLILADTDISDISPLANHEKLVFLEIFLTKVQDYSPLLTCTALEDLNLCYTRGAVDPLLQMTWLKRLWWNESGETQTLLREHLPNTEVRFISLSSTGDGWRSGDRYKEQRDILGMPYLVG